ncbi:MAG TPA: class I SAM-dependent methyltransferase [Fibrobacteria bacterium]|nr:class I SAM-dependent methyltransferase [Fibrobacteria bacterium]
MSSPEWFQRWFGDDYKRLYPHRDGTQATAQTEALLAAVRRVRAASVASAAAAPAAESTTSLVPAAPLSVLDVGCGAGRHLAALRAQAGVRAVGIDLSRVLLRDARRAGLAVARADMRRLPFADARFDVVASFFTSFGYFATADEDAATLREFVRVTRPGGFLFLDLPNRQAVVRDLVPADTATLPGRRVEMTRAVEGDVVVKRIVILSDDGETTYHEERVRLYELSALAPLFARAGLEIAGMMGDEHGAPFDPATSPRMSLLLHRTAVAEAGDHARAEGEAR